MKIKDIVKTASAYLGMNNVIAYLDANGSNNGDFGDAEKVIPLLVTFSNVVIGELASSFIPAVASEVKTPISGKILYSALSKTPLKINAVYDDSGNKVFFVIHPEYISVKESPVSVEYQYKPDTYNLNDDICYAEKDVPSTALALGVSAEYSLSKGSFEEASLWRERYVNFIANLKLPKSKKLKKRRWL